MELIAVLPDALLLRVRAAAPAGFTITAPSSVPNAASALVDLLDTRQVDLLVVDPADRRLEGQTRSLATLLDEYGWVPAILYTPLASVGIKAAAELLRHGVRALLLAGFDDQPQAIRTLFERLTANAITDRLLDALAHPLAHMPPSAVRAVRRLFGAPHRYSSVEDLASDAALTRRHLARVVMAVGLTSPWQLLVVARVMRAYLLLKPEGASLENTAARLRMDPRILSRHLRSTTGVESALAARALPADDLVDRCVRSLYRPPAALLRAVGDGPQTRQPMR